MNEDSVMNAREELKVVEQDREELEVKRSEAIKELESLRLRTKKTRDIVAKKLNTQEQKEILNLILKNFEFEIKNIELQAKIFKRDFKLREQDMIILRLEQHRSLCDTLIYQQRQLIVDNNVNIPQDLDELYRLYSRDVNDGQLLKDIVSVRSTSISAMANHSPKPSLVNPFLTQIDEENNELSTDSSINQVSSNYDNKTNENILNNLPPSWLTKRQGSEISNITNSTSNPNTLYGSTNDQNNKIFLRTNKIPQNLVNSNGNKPLKKQKEQIYYNVNTNYTSIDNNGGSTQTNLGPQLLMNSNKHINNLSSSTIDSNNPDIIYESVNNKNLISTTSPIKSNIKNGVLTTNNALINPNIVPPGQIITSSNRNINSNKTNPFNANYELYNKTPNYLVQNEQSFDSDVNVNVTNAKRLTQGIAAIAAQRKAQQHHQVLMQELGHNNNNYESAQNNNELTASRLARHEELEDYFDKKNLISDANNNKVKKQVKIKDIVEFKIHDEEISNDQLFVVRLSFIQFFLTLILQFELLFKAIQTK